MRLAAEEKERLRALEESAKWAKELEKACKEAKKKKDAAEKAEREKLREEKERIAEKRSREVAIRAQKEQEKAALERLRSYMEREAERRSGDVARKARVRQDMAAKERLAGRQVTVGVKALRALIRRGRMGARCAGSVGGHARSIHFVALTVALQHAYLVRADIVTTSNSIFLYMRLKGCNASCKVEWEFMLHRASLLLVKKIKDRKDQKQNK